MLVDAVALRAIREAELGEVLPHLPSGSRILEIGGGSGWQAARLAATGFSVESVDLASNPYQEVMEWPVRTYDGESLPYPSSTFDVVFSSNVLEHVDDLDRLMRETARVVKPGGMAIHLMPTSQWRLLTLVAHYPWLVKLASGRTGSHAVTAAQRAAARGRTPWWLLRRVIAAPRHGEHGTALGELWRFRRGAWIRRLNRSGWRVESDWGVGIVYSGYFVCHPWLPLRTRRSLSKVIGSSCRAYRLRQTSASV
jgi:SAM-dependent methyltransferase